MYRTTQTLRALRAAAFGLACVAGTGAAMAQAYPAQPIRMVVPYAPGGTTDIIARQLAQRMSEKLGQPVVVENKSGANTVIGADAVAKAQPDGYTLLLTNDATFVLNPVVLPSVSYNVTRDFAPVATIGYVPLVLAVSGSLPVESVKDLAAYAKARPQAHSYGSFGSGSQPHLMGALFNKLAGTDLVHVPYKGSAPAVADVVGGQILMTFPALPTIQSFVAAKKLKVLAVSGDKRTRALPQVPTFDEAGYKEMNISAVYGLLAPAKVPRAVVEKLNATVRDILDDKDFVEKNFAAQGMVPMKFSPEQFARYIETQTQQTRKIVALAGVKVE
ncbi:tripartite tricarboxylate transporter substrate binding protein [Cupriavidus sp. MP-37]|uniref:Bug family tripartite tricarboxylate transporter substrate binding protein n=1 Tax=Cupriavidus sp. MP-37 TaxID=2884455 RepID=UPI001D0B029D|nr:tripartite tricarboxylate transporter substrate binding protein [Cupriavidus sp. MP-37]UDM52681.1 tripartite tricarboxylate transporter substrate binding protein [Cupriavidus sp. MP-37]